MKACVLESVGNIEYKEVEKPSIKEGEVLLRIRACGICSSDIPRIYKTGTYHFPTIPGHEFAGEIVDVSKELDKNLIGKRAAVFPLLPCRKCPSCEIGEYARCDNYNYFGSRCDGGFSEYLAVPYWNLVFFSDEIPYSTAAICEPAAVAKHCVDVGKISIGDTVVIIGTGTIGLLAGFLAKIAGASNVIIVGHSKEKVDYAKQIGFESSISSKDESIEKYIRSITHGKGADVAIDCVGTSNAIENAIVSLKKGGQLVLTGNPDGDINIEKTIYWKILRNELKISGTWNSSYNGEKNDWKTILEFIENGDIPVDKLITHKYKLSEYEEALSIMKDKKEFYVKVMFEI